MACHRSLVLAGTGAHGMPLVTGPGWHRCAWHAIGHWPWLAPVRMACHRSLALAGTGAHGMPSVTGPLFNQFN
ncbi:unnamed protein product [Didymodactylos carnosus]|uniref:Uncharacterized protein n=1 Tax=Didymodactylos carnosus TaxID=1234261 RepID=A0A813XDG9_9BILA|nr:unnamed protein product [Didymodactylos carnosus]CAF3656503.1 unnamed protein product [Didymodactylos carnosus]